jgi:hypothetical protein
MLYNHMYEEKTKYCELLELCNSHNPSLIFFFGKLDRGCRVLFHYHGHNWHVKPFVYLHRNIYGFDKDVRFLFFFFLWLVFSSEKIKKNMFTLFNTPNAKKSSILFSFSILIFSYQEWKVYIRDEWIPLVIIYVNLNFGSMNCLCFKQFNLIEVMQLSPW